MAPMDATVDSSPPQPPSDPGSDKTPLMIRTNLPSYAVEAFGTIAGYQLIEKLGEGGMGTVYLAEDVTLKRRVAVKVMRPNIAAEPISRERFFREARAAAALEHDNIVAIHQVAEENGVPYLVMPLLKGESLGSFLQKNSRPDIHFILKVGRDVASGLAAAHAEGLVHRDIKPDNIWIEPVPGGDRDFRAKILDFGLARPRTEDGALLTRQGAFLGTPAYVSPEQARGLDVDNRADLFSLGCVLYEMSAGRRPFVGVDTMAVLTSLISEQPRDPQSYNPDVPPALAMLIMQLLEKDASRRPVSAMVVADLIKQIQAALSGGAQPSSIGRRIEEVPWKAPDEPRSLLPWFLLGLVAIFGAIGYGLYKFEPPKGPGSLEIVMDDAVSDKYNNKSDGIRITDANGKVNAIRGSARIIKTLAAGEYTAEILGAKEPLQLAVEDKGSSSSTKSNKITFKVEPGAVAKIRVVLVGPTSDPKGHSEKDKKDKY